MLNLEGLYRIVELQEPLEARWGVAQRNGVEGVRFADEVFLNTRTDGHAPLKDGAWRTGESLTGESSGLRQLSVCAR